MNYYRNTFYKNTFCNFRAVDISKIETLKCGYISTKSKYYFTSKGVYRQSNHWGRVASCRWRLQSLNVKVNQVSTVGYANWTDFYSNNEVEKLFFLYYSKRDNTITFHHKDSAYYTKNVCLRTAKDTAKAVRQCKELLETDTWTKYLSYDNINVLRKEWLHKIITTQTSLLKLRQEMLK